MMAFGGTRHARPEPGRRILLVAAIAWTMLGRPGSPAAQAPDFSCRVEWAPMRDGTRLATEVYLPPLPGPHPVVLTRSPYNRGSLAAGSNCDSKPLIELAQRGYAALNQDARGRYRSEGEFNPFQQERTDGYDAVEWAAVQPWSNGKVGVFGGSYVGVTTWQASVAAPPHLVTAVPNITASDYHDNWTYVNGAFDLHLNLGWTVGFLGADTYRRSLEGSGLSPEEMDRRVAAWLADARRDLLSKWVWTLPLGRFDGFRRAAPYYYDWLRHPTYDAYWRQVALEHQYERVTVPTLSLGGWYDVFAVGTVRNFAGLRQGAGSPAAREGAKLVMTCCGHTGGQGLIKWGPTAQEYDADLTHRWFDHYLKGVDNGVDREPPVRLFVMVPPDRGTEGSGFYVTGDSFPLPQTRVTRLYLGSGGHANTRNGDGVLAASPSSGPPDRFVYDPTRPVPTMGGALCCGDFLARGALDQATLELRPDILVYTSAPLPDDLAVIGSPLVTLWAASSASDTDFTAKLVDVHLDDIAHNVVDRIVRARFRQGSKQPPSLITPGRPYQYTIDLGPTATIFRKGHRVRLEVSSSNFPHFDRNPNTGRPFAQDALLLKATQTIYHDQRRPSSLELPVVPGVRAP